MVFLHFLLVYGRIQIRIRTNKLQIRMRIQEAQKHPTELDPYADPEHWKEVTHKLYLEAYMKASCLRKSPTF
jgi:hypothetical protein